VSFQRVLAASELWDGEMRRVAVGDRHVVLIRRGDAVHAYEDRCCHLGVPLSRGRLEDGVLRCSAHHWEFDVTTGHGLNPADARLKKFAVRCEGDAILIDLAPPAEANA
jgi:toluene monooxygenase system ferredoxin subunit